MKLPLMAVRVEVWLSAAGNFDLKEESSFVRYTVTLHVKTGGLVAKFTVYTRFYISEL